MSTATEQRHPSIKQDGGDERGIGDAAQAFNATLKAPCEERAQDTRHALSHILEVKVLLTVGYKVSVHMVYKY